MLDKLGICGYCSTARVSIAIESDETGRGLMMRMGMRTGMRVWMRVNEGNVKVQSEDGIVCGGGKWVGSKGESGLVVKRSKVKVFISSLRPIPKGYEGNLNFRQLHAAVCAIREAGVRENTRMSYDWADGMVYGKRRERARARGR